MLLIILVLVSSYTAQLSFSLVSLSNPVLPGQVSSRHVGGRGRTRKQKQSSLQQRESPENDARKQRVKKMRSHVKDPERKTKKRVRHASQPPTISDNIYNGFLNSFNNIERNLQRLNPMNIISIEPQDEHSGVENPRKQKTRAKKQAKHYKKKSETEKKIMEIHAMVKQLTSKKYDSYGLPVKKYDNYGTSVNTQRRVVSQNTPHIHRSNNESFVNKIDDILLLIENKRKYL